MTSGTRRASDIIQNTKIHANSAFRTLPQYHSMSVTIDEYLDSCLCIDHWKITGSTILWYLNHRICTFWPETQQSVRHETTATDKTLAATYRDMWSYHVVSSCIVNVFIQATMFSAGPEVSLKGSPTSVICFAQIQTDGGAFELWTFFYM